MLVLDDRTEVEVTTFHKFGEEYLMDIYKLKTRYDIYKLKTRYVCSTRKVTIYHELGLHPTLNKWSGDMIAFGEWWNLDEEEVEQARKFLEEKGYVRHERCDINDTQQSVEQ